MIALKYTLKDSTTRGMCLLEATKLDHSCKTLWHLESLAEPVQVINTDFKLPVVNFHFHMQGLYTMAFTSSGNHFLYPVHCHNNY